MHVHSRAGDIWRERFSSAGVLELDEPPVRLEIDLYAATKPRRLIPGRDKAPLPVNRPRGHPRWDAGDRRIPRALARAADCPHNSQPRRSCPRELMTNAIFATVLPGR